MREDKDRGSGYGVFVVVGNRELGARCLGASTRAAEEPAAEGLHEV